MFLLITTLCSDSGEGRIVVGHGLEIIIDHRLELVAAVDVIFYL